MKPIAKTLLAALCSLAFAGVAYADDPDPKAEPAESHHGGGDPGQVDKSTHPVEPGDPADDSHAHVGTHDAMHGGTHGMHGMRSCTVATTGDADADFALGMRHHHQMGVQMARTELASGDDAAMKAMAQKIIDAQSAEIAALDRWLAAAGVDATRHPIVCDKHDHGMHGAQGMHSFETLDANNDGYIGHGELQDTHPMHQHFAMADTDADGRLSRAEVEAHHAAMRSGNTVPRLTAAPHPPSGPDASAFRALDDNGDGWLAKSELAATDMLFQHFAAADTNTDGRLSPAEVDAHHALMHSQMKH
jgi:Ca2+-binding EF-hand superfamily protein